jgi:Membrane bound beta barrel domain (DUF5777)
MMIHIIKKFPLPFVCLLMIFECSGIVPSIAQDSSAVTPAATVKKKSFVRNTFEGNYLIDNQSVMVPVKGTFEFDIQHRFGTVNNGISDLYGIFSGATMRLGFSYVPIKNLQVGFGACNDRMQVDWNLKYALLRQTKDGTIPVSITYFGNVVMDTRKKDATTLFVTASDRFSFFDQVIIARKISDKLSIQVSPSLSHFNNVPGYVDANGKIQPQMRNDHFAISFSGRYKITPKTAIIANYDQPLTQHPMNNPHPNISLGLEMSTSGHTFQVFAGNYASILPQNNNMFNQNDFTKGQFLIGFNITRLWNF